MNKSAARYETLPGRFFPSRRGLWEAPPRAVGSRADHMWEGRPL
jgi:hypothetical protein